MTTPILFAHSAGHQSHSGQGSYDFVQFLRASLNESYEIHFPLIAMQDAPSYDQWHTLLHSQLANLSGEIILIGHSLGGSMVLKFLSEEKISVRITALLLVSTPFWGTGDWQVDEFLLRRHFQTFLPAIPDIHLFHCLNDPIVECRHMALYKEAIPHAVVHEMSGDDHAFAHGFPEIIQTLNHLKNDSRS